ncbi:rhodanese-like domain-containing protein, partial [Cutibacterium avidum]
MGLRDLLMNHGMAEGGLELPDVLNILAKGGVLVDVRTPREYEAGHAPGSRLVSPKELIADPFTAVYGDDPLAEPDPQFVLVCDTGFRSGHLVDRVREKGYTCDFLASG